MPLTENSLSLERRELSTIEQLREIASEWELLWRISGCSPFQSPMWLIPWAGEFTGTNLIVVTWRAGETLAGLAPFYSWTEPESGGRKLLLLGNGISDYLNVCVHPEYSDSVRDALSEWLYRSDVIEAFEWNQLPQSSCLTPVLNAEEWRCETTAGEPCLKLKLTDKSVSNFAPAPQLEKYHYYQRRAARRGNLEFEKAGPESCHKFMQELFHLHWSRWKSKGSEGMLGNPAVQRFHLGAAAALARSGDLRLYRMSLDSRTVAVLYGFADGRSTYFYLAGFDPAFDKLSPGALTIGHAIERAISEEQKEFNFLRGGEPYKYSWGASDEPTGRITGLRTGKDDKT